VEALAAHLPEAREGDVHGVHQARVATRRLREILPIVVDVRRGRGRRLARRLKQLTRVLGPVRELDVALALADAAVAARSAPAAVALRAHLTEARTEAFAELRRACDPGRAERLVGRLAKLVARHETGPKHAEDLPRRTRRALGQGVLDRARALADAVSAAGAILIVDRVHAVRIATKQLRYALELVGELRLARTAALVSSLRTVQDVLGRLHDLDVLRARTVRVRGEVPPDSIVARALTDSVAAIDGDIRHDHARYLRLARALVRLTDRVRDRVAPCLDPSISTSFATPSPKGAARPGPTTRSARSPRTAPASGGVRRRASPRSGRARTRS
jgi:CHAD domain-containing protein